MGLVKPVSEGTATAAASALVVADDRCCEPAIAALQRAVELETASVSVVALPERTSRFAAFAPLSGHVTCEELEQERVARADGAARRMAAALPAGRIDHRVASGWEQVTSLAASGRYDVLVLARLPRRARLRQLTDLCAQAGTALLIADGERA
jgi:hypothetical protein